MLTYRVGYAGSAAASLAMAQYLGAPTLDQELSAAARYYAGEVPLHQSQTERFAQCAFDHEMTFSEALDELSRIERAKLPVGSDIEQLHEMEERVTKELSAAYTRIDFADVNNAAPTNAVLRPDLSPALAKRLGIDLSLPLTDTSRLMS